MASGLIYILLMYAYALRRITLVLMHIPIQPPSSYKSSFSFKTSDRAETHDPSTYATLPPLAAFCRKTISL